MVDAIARARRRETLSRDVRLRLLSSDEEVSAALEKGLNELLKKLPRPAHTFFCRYRHWYAGGKTCQRCGAPNPRPSTY